MKVLQISTPFLPVSPHLKYGGTERIVYLLENGLKDVGKSAGVVAPADSDPAGLLFPTINRSTGVDDVLNREKKSSTYALYDRLGHIATSLKICRQLSYDIVHLHDDNLLPFGNSFDKPSLLTLHSDIDGFWNLPRYDFAKDCQTRLVAISNSQKKIYENAGFKVDYVVYNGVDEDLFEVTPNKQSYLLSLGSIAPVKGQDVAIEVAERAGVDLIIAGNIGNLEYFDTKIIPKINYDFSEFENKLEEYNKLPLSDAPKVVFVGPVNDIQKAELYSHAKAFLMPIGWEEPFGLVMVEAMLSGTPVIAYNRGSIPEVIDDEVTGFIVEDIGGIIEALKKIDAIDSRKCRERAMERFGKEQMINNYVNIYEELLT